MKGEEGDAYYILHSGSVRLFRTKRRGLMLKNMKEYGGMPSAPIGAKAGVASAEVRGSSEAPAPPPEPSPEQWPAEAPAPGFVGGCGEAQAPEPEVIGEGAAPLEGGDGEDGEVDIDTLLREAAAGDDGEEEGQLEIGKPLREAEKDSSDALDAEPEELAGGEEAAEEGGGLGFIDDRIDDANAKNEFEFEEGGKSGEAGADIADAVSGEEGGAEGRAERAPTEKAEEEEDEKGGDRTDGDGAVAEAPSTAPLPTPPPVQKPVQEPVQETVRRSCAVGAASLTPNAPAGLLPPGRVRRCPFKDDGEGGEVIDVDWAGDEVGAHTAFRSGPSWLCHRACPTN